MNKTEILTRKTAQWSQSLPQSADKILTWSNSLTEYHNVKDAQNRLYQVCQTLNRPLRVAICGENNAGKSTFVNVLVEAEIAVTDFFEFTFAPMVFSHGEDSIAYIEFVSGNVLNVDFDCLQDTLRTLKEEEKAHQVEKISVYLPLEKLKQYELADVPGILADDRNEQIARSFTDEVDAVVFVINGTLIGQTALDLEIASMADEFGALSIVINKIDAIGYENSSQAVEYLAQNTCKSLPIFPLAAGKVSEDKIAKEFFDTFVQDFLIPVGKNAQKVKAINVLSKCHRELLTINTIQQSSYYLAQRTHNLVIKLFQLLEKAETDIPLEIEKLVQEWIKHEAFGEQTGQMYALLSDRTQSSQIKSNDDLQAILSEKFSQKVAIEEAQKLGNKINQKIESLLYGVISEMEDAQNTFCDFFQIEKTAHILRQNEQNINVINPSANVSGGNGIAETVGDVIQNSIIGGIWGGGIATVITAVTSGIAIPTLTAAFFPIAIPAAIITFIWSLCDRFKILAKPLPRNVIEEQIQSIRLDLANQVVNNMFKEGIKETIIQGLSPQIISWKKDVRSKLWSNDNNLNHDLQKFAEYICLGEDLTSLVSKLRQQYTLNSNQGDGSVISHLSPAGVKAKILFAKPKTYSVSEGEQLFADLKAVVQLEEIELSFIDRSFTASELVWLCQVSSSLTLIQGWIYDVETDVDIRTEFLKTLTRQKNDRPGISIQVVKEAGSQRTPLNRVILAGSDWILELTQSFSLIGIREVGIRLISSDSEQQQVRDLITQYSSFSRLTENSATANLQFLTL